MTTTIKPKPLGPGDTIGVVAPAGPVDRERMERALCRVQSRGFQIKLYGDLFRTRGYLAGDDATRAAELMAAFADPDTRAVWCARGGYGVVRILDRIDFEVIRRNPKVFVGFSDITLLHIAIGQRTGLVTFHGPNLQDGFGKPDDMPAASEAALWRAVSGRKLSFPLAEGRGEGGSVRDKAPSPCPLPEGEGSEEGGYDYEYAGIEPAPQFATIAGGIASGPLTGGNLAVIAGVVGTPFEIETAGRILFLEDVSERAYRIDRYLSQLRMAGKLAGVGGVLLGDFSYEEGDRADRQADIRAVLLEYLGGLKVPVLAGFPAGHERINLTLPMGSHIELDADARQVRVLESCVAAG